MHKDDGAALLQDKIATMTPPPLLPDDVYSLIADFSSIDTLLALRHASKKLQAMVDEDLDSNEWLARTQHCTIEGLPAIKVKNRLTVACLLGPHCMVCGSMRRKKVINATFGVFGHEKCIRAQLVSLDTLNRGLEAIDITKYSRHHTLSGISSIQEEYCRQLGQPNHGGRLYHAHMWEMPRW